MMGGIPTATLPAASVARLGRPWVHPAYAAGEAVSSPSTLPAPLPPMLPGPEFAATPRALVRMPRVCYAALIDQLQGNTSWQRLTEALHSDKGLLNNKEFESTVSVREQTKEGEGEIQRASRLTAASAGVSAGPGMQYRHRRGCQNPGTPSSMMSALRTHWAPTANCRYWTPTTVANFKHVRCCKLLEQNSNPDSKETLQIHSR